MSNMEEQAREARAEAALTALISRCLLRPSLEFAEEVQRGEVADAFGEMLRDCPDEKVVAALGELRAFCKEAADTPPMTRASCSKPISTGFSWALVHCSPCLTNRSTKR